MASTKHRNNAILWPLFALTGMALALRHWLGIGLTVSFTLFAVIFLAMAWRSFSEKHRRFKAIRIANIDSMSGLQFERYLEMLLTRRGLIVTLTPGSGDLGVDLIASDGVSRFAIQAKRQNGAVSRRAISDAVAGMRHYGCTAAMVITNSYFTTGAKTLASSTECILVDRDLLSQWIVEARGEVGAGQEPKGRKTSWPEKASNERSTLVMAELESANASVRTHG